METEEVQKGNIVYPKIIEDAVLEAYSHYPELRPNPIYFKFSKDIGPSFMTAQPVISSLLKDKGRREYIIRMKPYVLVAGDSIPMHTVPHDVLVGWLGHELGHVIDYRDRSSINLAWLGIRYKFSQGAVLVAEKDADVYAMQHGLTDQILATKEFILKENNFPQWYQDRISTFYLTPEDIREIARTEGYPFAETLDSLREE